MTKKRIMSISIPPCAHRSTANGRMNTYCNHDAVDGSPGELPVMGSCIHVTPNGKFTACRFSDDPTFVVAKYEVDVTPPQSTILPRCIFRGKKKREGKCNVGCGSMGRGKPFDILHCSHSETPNGECSLKRKHTKVHSCLVCEYGKEPD